MQPAVCLVLLLVSQLAAATVAADQAWPGAEYTLAWSDDFNTPGPPDPANWGFERGFVRNNEAQWYQTENAFCEDGLLVIEGRREQRPNPGYRPGSRDWRRSRPTIDFTSASVSTSGRHAWQYGRFEVRARIVPQEGLWPAIWFLGERGEWPSSGEIDLMEFQQGDLLANACWGTHERHQPLWDNSRRPVASLDAAQGDAEAWGGRFHVWRMDWDAERIELSVDGQSLNTIDLSKTINPTDRGPTNPFHQPHYLLLNLAIGGDSGGDPSQADFPSRYEVDYVRVWQKQSP